VVVMGLMMEKLVKVTKGVNIDLIPGTVIIKMNYCRYHLAISCHFSCNSQSHKDQIY
jgi:hypothetical protein